MSPATVPMNAAGGGKKKKNVQDHQASPTSVAALSIDVNSPHHDHSSASTPDNNSKRNRRRRKGKARGNQVEPSPSPRSRNHYSNNKKKKNGSNNSYNNNNNNNGYSNNEGRSSSSFKTPIVSWRGSRGPRNSSNNNNNNRYNNSNKGRNSKNNWNHPSPRFNNLTSSPMCPASTGYPTSKKQHDAPMKKRDLYFALHVERVGIVSSKNETEASEQDQKAVARVTLTNWDNEFVLDTFVAIPVPVSDFYDTGIKPEHVEPKGEEESSDAATPTKGGSAFSFAAIRSKVERILRGKILIGYELEEGLQALGLNHPNTDMRDCSVYFSQNGGTNGNEVSSLETLSQKELNRSFQSAKAKIAKDLTNNNNDVMTLGKDSAVSRKPVQICVTTMDLYKKRRKEWETALIAQARERDRQQQDYLLKISQQRQQEQREAQRQAQAQQQARQDQYRENMMTVSLHCEMVRTALSGRTKTLARVTIVDGLSRNILLDEFAQIPVPVTDFCETGITDRDVMVGNENEINDPTSSSNAMPLAVLRGHVERILHRRVLVGYKVEECLKSLGLTHPWMQVRDVAFFPPFLHTKVVGGSTSVVTVRSLDELSEEFLRQRLRPLGDRSRPLDLCHCALGLYESFRGQWERHVHGQQQDAFLHQQQQQQQVHHPHHGRMMPPSPSAMMQSPHLRPNHFFGQQPPMPTYNAPMMMNPPNQQQLQRQVLMPEHQQQQQQQQQQYPDVQTRSNSSSSSWFPWGKQQAPVQNNNVGVSQTLSTQALQVLQEDFTQHASPSPKNHFLPVSSHSGASAFAERTSSYDGSIYGGDSEYSGVTSELLTESVISSLRDESSSVISGDQTSSLRSERKGESSSWFRSVLKKSKDQTKNDANTNCETVQETEVLTDAGMLPLPVELFPPSKDSDVDAATPETENSEEKDDEARSDSSSASPLMPRSWFGFRKSPVPRERSRSPASSFSHSTIEDLSITAQPEGFADTANEASIEITLSIPASSESDDTVSPLVEKTATTSLSSRPSWIGKLRSLKPSGLKSGNSNANSLAKDSTQSKPLGQADLKPAPTACTTSMDDDWFQEVMSQSTDDATQDLEPWLNRPGQAKSTEMQEKQLGASRGQASWFGFKRPKAVGFSKMSRLVSLDTTKENFNEAVSEDGTWSDGASAGGYWLPEDANVSAPSTIEHNNSNDINDLFPARARLPTESTIPSVTTDDMEEENSESESYSNELDFGAAQSFNFLKI